MARKEAQDRHRLVEVGPDGLDEKGNPHWILGFDKTGPKPVFFGIRKENSCLPSKLEIRKK